MRNTNVKNTINGHITMANEELSHYNICIKSDDSKYITVQINTDLLYKQNMYHVFDLKFVRYFGLINIMPLEYNMKIVIEEDHSTRSFFVKYDIKYLRTILCHLDKFIRYEENTFSTDFHYDYQDEYIYKDIRLSEMEAFNFDLS